MTRFACHPIDPATAARFRATGRDDRGNTLHRMTATEDGAFPCRVCLRYAKPGEAVLLGSYDLPKPLGVYWTPSPIFVHAEPCTPYDGANEVAEIVRRNAIVRSAPMTRMTCACMTLARSATVPRSMRRWPVPWPTRGPRSSTSIPRGRAACCVGWRRSAQPLEEILEQGGGLGLADAADNFGVVDRTLSLEDTGTMLDGAAFGIVGAEDQAGDAEGGGGGGTHGAGLQRHHQGAAGQPGGAQPRRRGA